MMIVSRNLFSRIRSTLRSFFFAVPAEELSLKFGTLSEGGVPQGNPSWVLFASFLLL